MPTSEPDKKQNGDTSLENLFDDDDDADMMLIDTNTEVKVESMYPLLLF
jgi:hypothetical protein